MRGEAARHESRTTWKVPVRVTAASTITLVRALLLIATYCVVSTAPPHGDGHNNPHGAIRRRGTGSAVLLLGTGKFLRRSIDVAWYDVRARTAAHRPRRGSRSLVVEYDVVYLCCRWAALDSHWWMWRSNT